MNEDNPLLTPTPFYRGLGFLVNMSVDIPYDTTYRLGSREPLFMGFGLVEIHREFIEFGTITFENAEGESAYCQSMKNIPGLGMLTLIETEGSPVGGEMNIRRTFLETMSHQQYMETQHPGHLTPEAIAEYMREVGIQVENVQIKTVKPTDETISMIGEASPGLEPHLGLDFKMVDCPECHGSGKYVGLNVTEFCATCDGSGKAYVEK